MTRNDDLFIVPYLRPTAKRKRAIVTASARLKQQLHASVATFGPPQITGICGFCHATVTGNFTSHNHYACASKGNAE